MAASVSPAEEIRDLLPSRNLPRALPYPLYAVLEPQLPPDGFLLLEELLQRLRERRRRGDLRAHDSGGLEPRCGVPGPRGMPGAPATKLKGTLAKGSGRELVPPHGCCTELAGGESLSPQQADSEGQRPAAAQTTARGKRCPVPRDELSLQSQSLNHPTCCKGSVRRGPRTSDEGDDTAGGVLLGAARSACWEGCQALLEHSPGCRTQEQVALGQSRRDQADANAGCGAGAGKARVRSRKQRLPHRLHCRSL